MTKEIWRLIPNYTNYMVSNWGNVKSLNYRRTKKEGLLAKALSGGYLTVVLCNKTGRVNYTVHVLVAMAFLGHIPCGLKKVVDHKNHIKTDNRLENLRIITQRKNTNRKHIKGICKSTGVTVQKNGKYIAKIIFNARPNYLGMFLTEKEASRAYKKALLEINKGTFVSKIVRKAKWYSLNKRTNTFQAFLYINKKQKSLGYFDTEQEAIDAVAKSKTNNP